MSKLWPKIVLSEICQKTLMIALLKEKKIDEVTFFIEVYSQKEDINHLHSGITLTNRESSLSHQSVSEVVDT